MARVCLLGWRVMCIAFNFSRLLELTFQCIIANVNVDREVIKRALVRACSHFATVIE